MESAKRAAELSLEVEISGANLAETKKKLEQAKLDAGVAAKRGESDAAIRIAESELELAREELARAEAARERFASSVSKFELLRLESTAKRKDLGVEDARHNLEVMKLEAESATAAVSPIEEALHRLQLEQQASKNEKELEQLTIERLAKAVEISEEQLNRRTLSAPIPGLVVERFREPGEWLEPGDAVVRVVRLDRLLVEGFVPSGAVSQDSVGDRVEVVVQIGDRGPVTKTAKIVFVSPEVDRVNQEVQVHAEIENADRLLRPGLPASMKLRTSKAEAVER